MRAVNNGELEDELLYQDYRCPVCGQVMVHDMAIFLTHTKAHILDLLRKNYPKWGPEGLEDLRLLRF